MALQKYQNQYSQKTHGKIVKEDEEEESNNSNKNNHKLSNISKQKEAIYY